MYIFFQLIEYVYIKKENEIKIRIEIVMKLVWIYNNYYICRFFSCVVFDEILLNGFEIFERILK